MAATTSARVRLAAALTFVSLLALGPAVAWDLTSQPPRAEPQSAWPRPSPWKEAADRTKDSARALARVYLPPRPDESAALGLPAAPTPGATVAAAVTPSTPVVPVPTVYRRIPHPTELRGIALE